MRSVSLVVRRVIVELSGHSPAQARAAARTFLQHTNSAPSLESATPRTRAIPAKHAQLERERMRAKVRGSKTLRVAVDRVIEGWRSAVIEATRVREADRSDVQQELDDAQAAGTITPQQRAAFGQRLSDAIAAMNPKALVDAIAAVQRELFDAGLQSAAGEVGIDWQMIPQRAIDALYHSTLSFSRDVVDREKVAIKDALLQGISAGDTIPELTARIQNAFDDGMHILDDSGQVVRVIPSDTWAEQVARTETTRAMNAGIFSAYAQAGVQKITWYAADDERTCPECSDADGETVLFGQVFDSVDVDGPPAHPSCRCTVVSADDEDVS